ncbi:hypothetical protein PHLCEN_2v198 [Hermanssonia centrifuga]|uniref:F-box domain-containing protein n=1 Tax=Hermanssonia centrifuga TaxID=98765 RepID=A0A2R6S6M0_9APHY|nr:hypothetical protein PHLCEN_2v198 [Hermanssonia centrifuga]
MPVHIVPVELLYAILTQVNKQDLVSCSLVSGLWRQVTLPQLFKNLRVSYCVPDEGMEENEDEHGKSLVFLDGTDNNDPVNLGWERRPRDLSLLSFKAFLKRSPDIAASVRFLALRQNERMGVTSPNILCHILNQLPSLTSLDLTDVVGVDEAYQTSPGPVVDQHLDRLSFSFPFTNSATSSLRTVVRVLAFFRSVKTLFVDGIFQDSADIDVAGLPLPLSVPRHLEIREVNLQSFVSVMQSTSLLRNIETLDIGGMRYASDNAQTLENLLVQVSPTLLHLIVPPRKLFLSYSPFFLAKYALAIASVDWQDSRVTMLVPLRRLETIYFKPLWMNSVDWSAATCLLPTIQRISTLHTIVLCLSVDSEAKDIAKMFIDAVPQLTRLEDIFLALARTSLRQVILSLKTWASMSQRVISCFVNVFPRLLKNGILKVYLHQSGIFSQPSLIPIHLAVSLSHDCLPRSSHHDVACIS